MRVRTDAKREAILEVASAVFLEFGFERTSMAEIAARLGGSKATLYGYFASKEELFLAVAMQAAQRHLDPIFENLQHDTVDLGQALRRFGERALSVLCNPQSLAAMRMMLAQVGRSDIAQRFYDEGPREGNAKIAAYLQAAMDDGRLRKADAHVAALHLEALLDAETVRRCLFDAPGVLSRAQIRQAVDRAVAVFMAAYGPVPGGA